MSFSSLSSLRRRHLSLTNVAFLFLLIFFQAFVASIAEGKEIYANPSSGSDSNTGLSIAQARKSLSSCLSIAVAGDTIFLLDGVYTGEENCNLFLYNLPVSFVGHSGNSSSVRIDCENKSRAFTISGSSIDTSTSFQYFTVQNAVSVNGTGGAFHLTESNPVFNHLVIQNCSFSSDAVANSQARGSAFYIASSQGNVQISNTKIINNSASKGALFVIRSNVTLNEVQCHSNDASENGGAIYAYRSAIQLHSSDVRYNTAKAKGGAFYFFMSILSSRDSVFAENRASLDGGGIYSYDSTVQKNTLISTQFLNNTSGGEGGGANFFAGAIEVTDVRFVGNRAASNGGGLYVYTHNAQTPIVSKLEAIENEAFGSGGGVFLTFSYPSCYSASVKNSRFVKNRASSNGGALSVEGASGCKATSIDSNYMEGNTAAGEGGGLHIFNLPVHVNDLISVRNTASSNGGGVYILVSDATSEETTIAHSSFSSNKAPQGGGLSVKINPVDAVLTVRSCNVMNNVASVSGGGIEVSSRADATIEDCRVSENEAVSSGAGLHLTAVNVDIKSLTAAGNSLQKDSTSVKGAGLFASASSSLTMYNSTFYENNAGRGVGAGVYLDVLSTSTTYSFDSCTFSNNGALQGAGLYCKKPSSFSNTPNLSVSQTSFSKNALICSVDTDLCSGGGLFLSTLNSVQLNNVQLLDNSATTIGSAQGVGAALADINSLSIKNTTVSQNTISGSNFNRRGAGLYFSGCVSVFMENSSLQNNRMTPDSSLRGTSQGAAMFVASSSVIVRNSAFIKNEGVTGVASTSNSLGGAVFVTSESILSMYDSNMERNSATGSAQSSGGALYADTSSTVSLYNSSCTSNFAVSQGGCAVFKDTNVGSQAVSCTVRDNSANVGGGFVLVQTTFSVQGSVIRNNNAFDKGGAAWLSSSSLLASQSEISANNATYRGGVHALPPNIFTATDSVSLEENSPSFYEPNGVWIEQMPTTNSIPPGLNFDVTPIVLLKDYYNETVLAGMHLLRITSSTDNVIMVSNEVMPQNGVAKFSNIQVLGAIGSPFYLHVSGVSIAQSADSKNYTIAECPLGYQSSVDRCLLCEEGYFSVNGSGCTVCPEGASCMAGIISPNENYWKESEYSSSVYVCPYGLCEQGGKCRSHHTGVLCHSCEEGYTRYNNRCVQCPQTGYQFWLIFPLVIWVIFSGLFLRLCKETIPVFSVTAIVFMQFILFMLTSLRHDISIVAGAFNLDASVCLATNPYSKILIINLIPIGWWVVFLTLDILRSIKELLHMKKISIRGFTKGNIEGMIWLNMITIVPTSIFNIAYFLPRSVNGVNYMALDFNEQAYTSTWAHWLAVPVLGLLVNSVMIPLFSLFCLLLSSRQKSLRLREAKIALAENVKRKISYMIKQNKTDQEIKDFEAKVNNNAHYLIYYQSLSTVFDFTFYMKHMSVKTGTAYIVVEWFEKLCWIIASAVTFGQPGWEYYKVAFLCIAVVMFWSMKLFGTPYTDGLQEVVLFSQGLLGLMAVVYLSSVSDASPSLKVPYDVVIFILWVAIILVNAAYAIKVVLPKLLKTRKGRVYVEEEEENQEKEVLLMDTKVGFTPSDD